MRSLLMILPLLVLGSFDTKNTCVGTAIDPYLSLTHCFNSSSSSFVLVKPSLKATKATGTSPFIESGDPTTAASATAR
jgi:hypothetical protein